MVATELAGVQSNWRAPGQWSGDCTGANIYSVAWPLDCIAPPYRPLMEQQAIVHLSGGVSEAIHRGARRSEPNLSSGASLLIKRCRVN